MPDPDRGRTLILLTRKFRNLPEHPVRLYVEPGESVPAGKPSTGRSSRTSPSQASISGSDIRDMMLAAVEQRFGTDRATCDRASAGKRDGRAFLERHLADAPARGSA